ncbi:aromatic ring hydroxylase [Epidermidibacterium keratini]|uniref:Aromatic ring hydroxylase n=1 Tax=Epidermidibacterium keratini TaxID=1891644 RepID=A0A7L4YL14_9ACTN|nr:FAD-dependent monooxygenase [Epidermidibacterium keratini]QHB99528.1 aromatic ring hydroxylase [Epidermidibacterium keratini]
MSEITVPVLIVGGGGCGLTSSILLSDFGVDHLMIERHPGTSHLPKSHYLNQRTMEIFRQHAVADSIYEVSSPMENMSTALWCTSIGGDGPFDRKILARLDAFGGGGLDYEKDGPARSANYSQVWLEPILLEHAQQRGPGRQLFRHELIGFTQDEDGVTAQVRNLETGDELTVRSQYLIGADGGKTVGKLLGIEMHGPAGLVEMVTTHFSADLSEYCDDTAFVNWMINPEGKDGWSAGVLAPMGPTWGNKSENWVMHFAFAPDDPARNDEAAMPGRIRELLKISNLQMDIRTINHWIVEGVVAERYQDGRVFLGGDAAHRHPPTTGLGLNTAFQDAHNLAWKIAAVVNGQAGPELLDTYEAERYPVGVRNVDWAMFTFFNHMLLDAGLGLTPGATLEQKHATFEAYFDDSPMGETRRALADEVFNTQRTEFQAHDLEVGFRYDAGALVPDGSEPPPRDPMGHIYHPTTRPGHRLPHAWLESDGQRLSTHDLVGTDGFVLITGSDTAPWQRAALQACDQLGTTVKVVGVGGGYADVDGRWAELREISDSGAVLVRPDNHVAWRVVDAPSDPSGELTAALRTVLSR